jgi:hypothetical protein
VIVFDHEDASHLSGCLSAGAHGDHCCIHHARAVLLV